VKRGGGLKGSVERGRRTKLYGSIQGLALENQIFIMPKRLNTSPKYWEKNSVQTKEDEERWGLGIRKGTKGWDENRPLGRQLTAVDGDDQKVFKGNNHLPVKYKSLWEKEGREGQQKPAKMWQGWGRIFPTIFV